MTALVIIVGSYFGVLLLANLAVAPLRRRMFEDARSLLDDGLSDDLAGAVHEALTSAYSMREAPLLLFTFIGFALRPVEHIKGLIRSMDGEATFWDDRRVQRLMSAHFASIAAVNPLFGALAYLVRLLVLLKLGMAYQKRTRRSDRARIDAKALLA